MTRDEWEAATVERTLCNDWKDSVEKKLWMMGPCRKCGSIVEKSGLVGAVTEFMCRCGALKATVAQGEVIPPCPECGSQVTANKEYVVLSEINQVKFWRFNCQCRYLRMKV